MPDEEYYGDFTQLENGVGLSALLKREFLEALERPSGRRDSQKSIRRDREGPPRAFSGSFRRLRRKSFRAPSRGYGGGEPLLRRKRHRYRPLDRGDIAETMKKKDPGEALLICESTLRYEHDRFLDDKTPEELEHELGVPVLMVKNDGYSLLCAMLGEEEESRCEVLYGETD
jgi:hypothetical protein